MAINLNYLKTFSILSENRHFSKTAKKLNIAQPAVSRQIKELEKQLNVTLFLRDNKRVELTPQGKLFAEQLGPLITGLDNCLDGISNFNQEMTGEILFSAPKELGELLFIPFLKKFIKMYPFVKVDLRLGSTSQIQEQILSGEIDCGITLEPSLHENLSVFKLMAQKSFLVTNHKTDTTDIKYRNLKYIAYKKQDRLLQRFVQKQIRGISMTQIEIPLCLNSHRAIVDFLTDQKDLFAVLPYFSRSVKESLDKKKIKKVGSFELESDFFLTHPNWEYTPKLYTVFYKELKDYFKAL